MNNASNNNAAVQNDSDSMRRIYNLLTPSATEYMLSCVKHATKPITRDFWIARCIIEYCKERDCTKATLLLRSYFRYMNVPCASALICWFVNNARPEELRHVLHTVEGPELISVLTYVFENARNDTLLLRTTRDEFFMFIMELRVDLHYHQCVCLYDAFYDYLVRDCHATTDIARGSFYLFKTLYTKSHIQIDSDTDNDL